MTSKKNNQLSAEQIKVEEKNIDRINMEILIDEKKLISIPEDKQRYINELLNKEIDLKNQLREVKFDLDNDYSFKLALSKRNELIKNIERLQKNREVHQRRIESGRL